MNFANTMKTQPPIIHIRRQFFCKINFADASYTTVKNLPCASLKTALLDKTLYEIHNKIPFCETLQTHSTHSLCFTPVLLFPCCLQILCNRLEFKSLPTAKIHPCQNIEEEYSSYKMLIF